MRRDHLRLRTLHHGSEREEKLTIRERVIRRLAVNDRRQQVRSSFRISRVVSRVADARAGFRQSVIDHRGDALSQHSDRQREQVAASGSAAGRGWIDDSFCGQRLGDSASRGGESTRPKHSRTTGRSCPQSRHAITSIYCSQLSASSSPRITLLKPGPWISMRGSLAHTLRRGYVAEHHAATGDCAESRPPAA